MELMLAGWHKDHSAGTKVVFWIADEDLEYFESMTVKKGKQSGQRLAAALVEIGDDDQPVPHETTKASTSRFPPGRTGLAVRWCLDTHFQDWIACNFPKEFVGGNVCEQATRDAVCRICGVMSRKELDVAVEAAENFDQRIRVPYSAQRKADNLD